MRAFTTADPRPTNGDVVTASEPTAATPEPEEDEGPTCPCGHGIGHHMVSDEEVHGVLGRVAVLTGISWPPRRIDYRCRRCGKVFASVIPDRR